MTNRHNSILIYLTNAPDIGFTSLLQTIITIFSTTLLGSIQSSYSESFCLTSLVMMYIVLFKATSKTTNQIATSVMIVASK